MKKCDLIGWIGNLFFIIGAYLIATKSFYGFICNGLGNLCYLLQGYFLKMSSLLIISLILLTLNIYGILKWL